MRPLLFLLALLMGAVCLPVGPAHAQWGSSSTPADKLRKATVYFEKGRDSDAMDLFMDVLLAGDDSQKAVANDYLNRITSRMAGVDPGPRAQVPAPAAGAASVEQKPAPIAVASMPGPGPAVMGATIGGGMGPLGAAPAPKAAVMAPPPPMPAPAPPPMAPASPEPTAVTMTPEKAAEMRKDIEARLEAMRKAAIEGLRAEKDLRLSESGERLEAAGFPAAFLFDADAKFRFPASERPLSHLAAYAFAAGDAHLTIYPEGFQAADSKVLDMRRAMALRSYLTGRGISPARVRVALLGTAEGFPEDLKSFRGVVVRFSHGASLKLGQDGPAGADGGPTASLGLWPGKLKADGDEGVIIEFSVLEPREGLGGWRFEMLSPAPEGRTAELLQAAEGEGPVLHQVYWNGRRSYFGEALVSGTYKVVLRARTSQGRETVVEREIRVEGSQPGAAEAAAAELPAVSAGVESFTLRKAAHKLRPEAARWPVPKMVSSKPKPAPPKEAAPPAEAAGPAASAMPAHQAGTGSAVNYVIYFAKDSTEMVNYSALQNVPATVEHYPLANLNLIGYAFRGEKDPAALAEKRVQVVADRLIRNYRIDKAKIYTQSQVVEDENTKVEIYVLQSP